MSFDGLTRDNTLLSRPTMRHGDAENSGVASANDITICAVSCKTEPSDAVRTYVEAGIAPATRRAYRADLEHFALGAGTYQRPTFS